LPGAGQQLGLTEKRRVDFLFEIKNLANAKLLKKRQQ
jgi:hypothetical protein